MSNTKPFAPDEKQLKDEALLVKLLDQHAIATKEESPDIKTLEQEILAVVSDHFRQALKPVLLKTFGHVVGEKADATVRYTNVVNDFFIKVLKQRDDDFWRAKTAKQLRSWASVVMANQIRDHLRRKKHAPQVVDDIAAFADQRQIHFEKYNNVKFEKALDLFERWKDGTTLEREMALILQHRYVDGMSYEDIAMQLGMEKEKLYRIAEAAKKRLREEGNRETRG